MANGTTVIAADRAERAAFGPVDLVAPGPAAFLALAVWAGLASGLLEVGAFACRKSYFDPNQFLWTSRHFVWVVPLVNLAIFLVLGVPLAVLVWLGRRRAPAVGLCLLGALTLLPAFWAAFPRIHSLAGLVLVLGLMIRALPMLERHIVGFGRVVKYSIPLLIAVVLFLAASRWTANWTRARNEQTRALPPPGSANVLLIVLDTVAAGHLSLYGYGRQTSPAIDELATRGIRFETAIATSSWTLPSHAGLLTGRWPHELSANWFTPLDGSALTLAEYLGSRGYATAGFVANQWYCASDTGLARGFTEYRDYAFPRLTACKTAGLVNHTLNGLETAEQFLDDWLDLTFLGPVVDQLQQLFMSNRKEAATVSREFLHWLSRRQEPARPFFAFLNYYDAHYPYELPRTGYHRFRPRAKEKRERELIRDWPMLIKRSPTPQMIDLGRDYYDNCVADLDEQIGRLCDELHRLSILEKTWVIVTADHGESFGEQPGVFWHGTALYQPQIHVPLVIIPPADGPAPRVVTETVSLRDIPSTVVDVLGAQRGSPFPGASLARFWKGPSSALAAQGSPPEQALSEVVPLESFGADPSQWTHKPRWPLAALVEDGWKYIRREENKSEELFHLKQDPLEGHNRAAGPAEQGRLAQKRAALGRLTNGPLTPERFRP